MRARYMWKYATSSGAFGTPAAFVNGVMLQNFPENAAAWLTLLNEVYDSQTTASRRVKSEI